MKDLKALVKMMNATNEATDKEIQAIEKLYMWVTGDQAKDNLDLLQEDIENDCYSEMVGQDGQTYIWYRDEAKDVAINIDTMEVIDNSEVIDDLFC